MKGFFSVKRDAGGQWFWVLYSNNHREMLRSSRTFNQPGHARDAARRLHKVVAGASFSYGVGFRKSREAKREAAARIEHAEAIVAATRTSET